MKKLIWFLVGFVMFGGANYAEGEMSHLRKATFAGGCFWCMEKPFEDHEGVAEAVSGYTGGKTDSPTYEEVSSGMTGHFEAVEISYDPEKISYENLLDIFWRQINPTDEGGQFNDRGTQYQTAIFYHDDEQKALAEKSKQALDASNRYDQAIVTGIIKATEFFKAETYHQDYYKTCPLPYKNYKTFSGREAYLKETWKDK